MCVLIRKLNTRMYSHVGIVLNYIPKMEKVIKAFKFFWCLHIQNYYSEIVQNVVFKLFENMELCNLYLFKVNVRFGIKVVPNQIIK